MQDARERTTDVILGRNAVLEALRSGRQIEHVMVARGERTGSIGKIIAMAKEKRIPVKEVDSRKLEAICGGNSHQGVAVVVSAHRYAELEDIFALAAERGEDPFLILCDNLEDPHNLGAIIRTAEAAGVHGVIIPRRRSAGLTTAVAKTASGALEYVPVVRVSNLATTLDLLKDKGLWIYGADMEGKDYKQVDYSGGVALVIGSEGEGLSRLVREKCDFLLSLPMRGRINSLNASVAAGIFMYQVMSAKQKDFGTN